MSPEKNYNRRDFIKKAGQFSGALIGLSAFGALLPGCEQEEMPFEPTGTRTIYINDYPQLKEIGGSASIRMRTIGFQVIIVRKSEEDFLVANSTCTHMGCTVDAPRTVQDNLLCPCHGSEFSREDASVIWFPEGFTPRPLKKYNWYFDKTTQTLQIDFSVTV